MSFEVADDQPTPFDRFSNVEDRERIAEALLQLDTLYREVLVLRFHEELSLEEIAKVTRAPLSTVKSRLYRGLAAIKPKLRVRPSPPPGDGVKKPTIRESVWGLTLARTPTAIWFLPSQVSRPTGSAQSPIKPAVS